MPGFSKKPLETPVKSKSKTLGETNAIKLDIIILIGYAFSCSQLRANFRIAVK